MSAGDSNAPQRAYRATCSFCGADVAFRSAASACAVCSYCRSTLVRDGETLRKVGESASLFDNHSPLQLGASGRYLGEAFTLIGRVQWAYPAGTWNEWRALFDNGRSGWLAEDNAGHVFGFDAPVPADAPMQGSLQAGQRTMVDGRAWDVASVYACTWTAAEGELTWVPRKGESLTVAELRNAQDEVGTLEYRAGRAAQWSVGRAVALVDLALQGTRDHSEATVASRGLECPSCGAAIELKLESARTVVCQQCQAVVDVSQGIGGDLAHYRQAQGDHEPLLPLGSMGRFAFGGSRPVSWQVVGYQERRDVPALGSDDEQTFWREYLLFNREAGFAFLVDAEDGWSWMRPLTGVPIVTGIGARWQGDGYRLRWPEQPKGYKAETVFVLGEFYWRVVRGERQLVADYVGVGSAGQKRLSRERSDDEVVWSGGETLAALAVGEAFGWDSARSRSLARYPALLSSGARRGLAPATVIVLVLALLLILLFARCSSDDCDDFRQLFGPDSREYRECVRTARVSGSSGGSWGGYSSGGGGHK